MDAGSGPATNGGRYGIAKQKNAFLRLFFYAVK